MGKDGSVSVSNVKVPRHLLSNFLFSRAGKNARVKEERSKFLCVCESEREFNMRKTNHAFDNTPDS